MIKIIYFLILFVFGLILGCSTKDSTEISLDSVKIENGLISGIKGNNPGIYVFKGIPYAAPPIDGLRWKEPQPVTNWKGVKKCETFGPNAMQQTPVPRDSYTSEFFTPLDEPMSEDCLYLNVWTAARSSTEKRPVLVYIHGGGFVENSGSVITFDGESFAQKGVVLVTINYRLGIFGFFAHPDLSAESLSHTSGNYGIQDQIAALRWVKSNISAFGGDPENITIAGQSAGALSVNALSVSPLSRGLFNKIIAESGACVLGGTFGGTENLQEGEKKGMTLMTQAGVNSLSELRTMPAPDLEKLFPRGIGLIVDGYVLEEPIPETYAKEKQANVPLLTGWNADETVSDTPITLSLYRDNIIRKYGDQAEVVFKLYPASNDREASLAQKKLSGDSRFGLQNYAWAKLQSKKEGAKAFLYYFNRNMPAEGDLKKFGAFHTAEIPYVFGTLTKFKNRPWETADFDLSNLMSSYWVNFITTGDPNGAGLVEWPVYDARQGKVMVFDVKSEVVKHPYYDALEVFCQKAGN